MKPFSFLCYMGRKKILFQLILAFLFASCGSKQKQVYARITERKHLNGGKLLISYSFANEGRIYKGDTTVNNTVIPNDSVLITFSSNNPTEGKLQIP